MSSKKNLFWSIGDAGEDFHALLKESIRKARKYYNEPQAVKQNLAKTDVKMINNVLNTAGRILSAQSGITQGMAVLAARREKSDEFKEFVDYNLPQFKPTKLLKD